MQFLLPSLPGRSLFVAIVLVVVLIDINVASAFTGHGDLGCQPSTPLCVVVVHPIVIADDPPLRHLRMPIYRDGRLRRDNKHPGCRVMEKQLA